jgi:ubiquinone/menaquinone biosynthesis C-methylase UbiE
MMAPTPVQVGETLAHKQQSYELVPRGVARVLDVGCGTGEDVLSLAERLGPACLVVGVDRSLERVEEAQRALRHVALNVRFAVGDARLLPFPDESFDVVRADGLFSELAERRRVMQELVRVIAPAGRLLVHDVESVVLAPAGDEHDLLGLMRHAGISSIEVRDTRELHPQNRSPRQLTLVGLKPPESESHVHG